MTLQEFIDDARRQSAARRAERDALRDRAVNAVIDRLKASIPQPLHEFIVYVGPPPPENIQMFGPREFSIVAPGLQPMPFRADERVDWIERVAVASEPLAVKAEPGQV